jgi:hypothetical protein
MADTCTDTYFWHAVFVLPSDFCKCLRCLTTRDDWQTELFNPKKNTVIKEIRILCIKYHSERHLILNALADPQHTPSTKKFLVGYPKVKLSQPTNELPPSILLHRCFFSYARESPSLWHLLPILPVAHSARQLCFDTASSSRGGGTRPKCILQLKSSKFGSIYSGMPSSRVKNV